MDAGHEESEQTGDDDHIGGPFPDNEGEPKSAFTVEPPPNQSSLAFKKPASRSPTGHSTESALEAEVSTVSSPEESIDPTYTSKGREVPATHLDHSLGTKLRSKTGFNSISALTSDLTSASANSVPMPARYPPTSYPQGAHTRASSVDKPANVPMPIRPGTPAKRAPPQPSEEAAGSKSAKPGDIDPPSRSLPLPTPAADSAVKDDVVGPGGAFLLRTINQDGNTTAQRGIVDAPQDSDLRGDSSSSKSNKGSGSEILPAVDHLSSPLPPFNQSSLLSSYHSHLASLDQRDTQTMEDLENTLDMFKAWQMAGKMKEEERAQKRLRTQSRIVEDEEARLRKKRETHARAMETLRAFMDVLRED